MLLKSSLSSSEAMSPRFNKEDSYRPVGRRRSFTAPLQDEMRIVQQKIVARIPSGLKKRMHRSQSREGEMVNVRNDGTRHVHFNDVKQILNPDTEYYTDEDVAIKWWHGDDLCFIKTAAKNQSLQIRKTSKFMECSLTKAHSKIVFMAAGDIRSLVQLSDCAPDQDLQYWCSYTDGRRGLERFASKDYSGTRRRDVQMVRLSVLEEQRRQRQQAIVDDEAIARTSLDLSRRARTFAHCMAKADAKHALTLYSFFCQSSFSPQSDKTYKVSDAVVISSAIAV